MLDDLALICRFDTIFRKHFKDTFCKGSEHLWIHVNEDLVDSQMPTNDHKRGMPIDLRRTGMCPHMMLYALDEFFYVFRGIGVNAING